MKSSSKGAIAWRRPPLALVVLGLAIVYAELAIESELLSENGLAAASQASVDADKFVAEE